MKNIIRKLRGNLSQKEFAEKVGITQAAVSIYEKGRKPKIEILERIAAATGKKITIVVEDIKEEDSRDRLRYGRVPFGEPRRKRVASKMKKLRERALNKVAPIEKIYVVGE